MSALPPYAVEAFLCLVVGLIVVICILLREPVWADPELERLHGAMIRASQEHGRRVKAGELTAEDFTEDFNVNVMPAIKAWEDAIAERMS